MLVTDDHSKIAPVGAEQVFQTHTDPEISGIPSLLLPRGPFNAQMYSLYRQRQPKKADK
jgi:hypothetical protein